MPDLRADLERTAAALPDARIASVDGGHIIDPGHPSVIEFVSDVLRSASGTP